MDRGRQHVSSSWLAIAALAAACTTASDDTRGVVGTKRLAATLPPTWFDHTTSVAPPARTGHAMAFDAARGKVVLFGGEFGGPHYGDTWLWDGSAWQPVTTATQGPAARRDHGMAFDAARGEVVVFGGRDAQGALSDTWAWNGSAWSPRTPATKPPARSAFGMAYDEAQPCVAIFILGPSELPSDRFSPTSGVLEAHGGERFSD